MVHFYGLVSCSDPGLRISLSPGLLHHCSKAMNSDLLKMRLHSLDMFNCMRPIQKLHNKDKKYFCLNIYKELFAFMVVKTKKCWISVFCTYSLHWGFTFYMTQTHQHLLALTVECPLWRRSDGLGQTGSYHSMSMVPSLLPRCTCSAQSKVQTGLIQFMIHSELNEM